MIRVELTQRGLNLSREVGRARTNFARSSGLKNAHGIPMSDAADADFLGACGECVVWSYTGVEWNPKVGKTGPGDVGLIEVFTTTRHNGHMLLHPEDPDECPSILVTGSPPVFFIRGWIYIGTGKAVGDWPGKRPDRPAFWISQDLLWPMETFLEPRKWQTSF